ncbi:helix-turn-helix domain-containing protein [Kordiimonas sp.]|uniref:helix-turn-helix domain-containing protein n=1 Tax=Kordiimonas sp. TaxID=1970157 RepID=UPI003A92D8EA
MKDQTETVGELLKAARLSRGTSIDSVAKDICIRTSYLTAIENGAFDELPGKTFAVGFVRAYAAHLSLDSDSIAQAFKKELGIPEPVRVAQNPMHKPATPVKVRRLPAWLSPLSGIVGVALCWAFLGSSIAPFSLVSDDTLVDAATDTAQLMAVQATLETDKAPSSEVVQTLVANIGADVPQSTELGSDATEAKQQTSAPKKQLSAPSLFLPAANAMSNAPQGDVHSDIVLSANEDAWVRLSRRDGTEIWSGVLREGQSYRPFLEGSVLLSTSNAGGVSLTIGEKTLTALGERGEVVNELALDGDSLRANVAAHAAFVTGSR